MKVLITTDWYLPTINGVVNSVIVLRDELIKLGHDVEILTLSPTIRSYKLGNVTYIGSISAEKVYPEARVRSRAARDLITSLIMWKPDVIHSQCELSTFNIARKISNATSAPIVHTYHTVYEDYSHYFMPSTTMAHRAVSVFSKYISKHVDCLIAPTEKIRTLLRSYKIHSDIRVVPSGIDLSIFTKEYSDEEINALKTKLGIPEGNKVLINIGRIAKEKNVDDIIYCMSKLDRRDVTLLLVGDGPFRQRLEEIVRPSGLSVIFAGMIPHDDIGIYYKLGDIFVSASTSETQGLTYDEALASGLPALCRKDPCIDGVVIDGFNGWQFSDSNQFIDRLNYFLSDPELGKSMSQNAVESSRKFSAPFFASSVVDIYNDVISQKQSTK